MKNNIKKKVLQIKIIIKYSGYIATIFGYIKEGVNFEKYFGTDGIRRVANTGLTPELAYKVAKAGAYVLAKHASNTPTILIGRDTRLSGNLIESAMIAGFLSYGANVKVLGVIPTPAVAYLTKNLAQMLVLLYLHLITLLNLME